MLAKASFQQFPEVGVESVPPEAVTQSRADFPPRSNAKRRSAAEIIEDVKKRFPKTLARLAE